MPLLRAPKHTELKPEELKLECNVSNFDFESTSTLKPIEGIVGQERAIKALKIGVEMKSPGYNIFVTGLSGTGKFTTIRKVLETMRPDGAKLKDYAYVNNFEDPDRPKLLIFPAGEAKKFKKDLISAIKFLREKIPNALENEPFLTYKKKLVEKFTDNQRKLMSSFEEELKKEDFTLGQVKSGDMVRPEIFALVDKKPVLIPQLEEFVQKKKISRKKAEEIVKKYAAFQEELQLVFKKSFQLSQDYKKEINELEQKAVRDIIHAALESLKEKYPYEKVKEHLEKLGEDILLNLDTFKGLPSAEDKPEDFTGKDFPVEYDVNVILDNSSTKERPVIIETSPTFANLFGVIEKSFDPSGGWYSDFTQIKAGSLLRANGGYLILNALDAFSEPGVWKTLKRVMLYGKLEIQDFATLYQFSPSILKPEPIEINTKIIFIGNNELYSLLSEFEHDFNKIFKIKADFDYEMKRTPQALNEYAGVVKKLIETEGLLEFDKSAIAKIIEFGSRYAGRKDKLTTRFAYVADLAREASFWAKDDGEKIVSAYHVQQAYDANKERNSLGETKIQEAILENVLLIDTEGKRVGQINGLAVYSNGKYSFGKPTRITASVSLGNGSIINVEREAGLSGSAHNKGVLIISGYFREKFGRKIPLSFTASLVFEQGYGMIDGDSASITEICALLSTISGIPIKQSLAITGSVNQKGDIQPIGGVNEKIEGFFDVCKARGLNKKQGVIIPARNVKDLMLKDEIIEAVKNKEFHIYSISTVEEAIELLTGVRAGKLLKSGHYQANTVFGEVEKKLREMRKLVKPAPPKTENKSKSTKKKTAKK